MNFKEINLGRKYIGDNEWREMRSELFDPDEVDERVTEAESIQLMEKIKTHVDKLHYIVYFGDGFWAGALDNYTLVYRPETDSFFILHLHYEKEELVIKYVPETDAFFSLLKDFNALDQFDDWNDYFTDHFPTLSTVTYEELGFGFLSEEQFKYGVWFSLPSEFYNTKDELEREVRTYETKRHINEQERFFAKYADKPMNLHYEDGKVYVILDGNVKKEILL